MAKFHRLTTQQGDAEEIWIFKCPGCKYGHSIRTKGKGSCWTWNENLEAPTADPSLLIFQSDPDRRCHLFIRDGNLQFLDDCFHSLAGQTVPIPDFEL